MRDRTKVHTAGDLTLLQQELGTEVSLVEVTSCPAQVLPLEYGGSNGTIAELTAYWKVVPAPDPPQEEVTANREVLLTMSKYKTDEARRPGKPRQATETRHSPRSHADLFGIEGSFRKLDID